MKRRKETPSPVERKKMESMDKNDVNTSFGISGESDFPCESFEVIERSAKCENVSQKLNVGERLLQEDSSDNVTILDILKEVSKDIKDIKNSRETILGELGALRKQVQDQGQQIKTLQSSQSSTSHRVAKLEKCVQIDFNPELTIVAINAPRVTGETPMDLARRIVHATGGGRVNSVINAKHTTSFENRRGVFKMEIATLEDKIDILQKKKKLKDNPSLSRVYLRSSQTHTERLMHLNFKQLLQEVPNGNHYRITGSGRLVKQTEGYTQSRNQRQHQRDPVGNGYKAQAAGSANGHSATSTESSWNKSLTNKSNPTPGFQQKSVISQPASQLTYSQVARNPPQVTPRAGECDHILPLTQMSQDSTQSQFILHLPGQTYAYTDTSGHLQTFTPDQTLSQDIFHTQNTQFVVNN